MQKPQKKVIQKVNIIGTILSAVAAATVVFFVMNKQLNQCVNALNEQKNIIKNMPVAENKPQENILPALMPKNVEIFNKTACYHILDASVPNRCASISYQSLDTQLDWLNQLLLDNKNQKQIEDELKQQLEQEHNKNTQFIAQEQQISTTKITVKEYNQFNMENVPVANNTHSVIFLNQKGKMAQFQIHDNEYAFGMAHGIFSNKYRVFDLQRQQEITWDNLLIPSKRHILAKILRDRLNENQNLGDDYLVKSCENKEECIAEELLKAQFYFDKDGIIFSYDPYQVAPYSQGVVELKPEYWELQGIINSEYLPYR
ncbi:MAG: DUF3298 domain-containing protein [Neisseriaceae bacterium]|nr:DUF3298 domain-containing protein [Neisseriaceae bacterium]